MSDSVKKYFELLEEGEIKDKTPLTEQEKQLIKKLKNGDKH